MSFNFEPLGRRIWKFKDNSLSLLKFEKNKLKLKYGYFCSIEICAVIVGSVVV